MRMLFLQHGEFSGINAALRREWLGSQTVDIDAVDLRRLTMPRWTDHLRAFPAAWNAEGRSLLRGGFGGLRGAVKRSAWYAAELSATVEKCSRRTPFDFSLSMQTLIPLPRPSRPNFVFTDQTILCNTRYAGGRQAADRWQEYLPYERDTLRAASAVFTMSEHARTSVVELYGVASEHVFCVGAGCNAPAHAGSSDAGRYARENIVFVGFDWERKGGPELLEAFTLVRRRCPRATLTIVGASPRLAAPGVEVVGAVPLEEVSGYLARASVFCMPSRREPFGIVYLEAMRAGLPVVALRQGAVLDFVLDGDTGVLTTPGDIPGLAEQLTSLLSNPDGCRAMGERGRALVAATYTWPLVRERMWRVIRERVRPSPAGAR